MNGSEKSAPEFAVDSNRACAFRLPPARFLLPAGLAAAYFWLLFVSTLFHIGRLGPDYNAVGTDWMVFHGAARSYLGGHFNDIFDGERFTAFLNKSYAFWLTAKLSLRPWVYPPSYLLLVLPFGFVGLVASYVLFQVTTAGALAVSVFKIPELDTVSRRTIALAALISPAAAVNAILGQNGFLTGAILVAGVGQLGRRPYAAGLILGLATIKPQFAILGPFALIAAREWKALLAAAASAVGLAAISIPVFGLSAWTIWIQQTLTSLVSPNPGWIEYGRLWGDSVWTCAVLSGAPAGLASALQGAAMLAGIAFVFVAFRRTTNALARLSVLLPATLLAAPHWMTYDAVLLTLAGLFWLTRPQAVARAPYSWIVVLLIWVFPFFSPVVIVPFARPLVPLLLLGFIFLAMPRRTKALEQDQASLMKGVAPTADADGS